MIFRREGSNSAVDLLNSLAGSHILLVEENEINQQLDLELLQRQNVIVGCVDTGQAALQAIQTQVYDLVLLDLHISDMDPWVLCQHIRAHAPLLPILGMSTSAIDRNRIEPNPQKNPKNNVAVGINAHLLKPVNPVEFYKTLAYWLNLKTRSLGSGLELAPTQAPASFDCYKIQELLTELILLVESDVVAAQEKEEELADCLHGSPWQASYHKIKAAMDTFDMDRVMAELQSLKQQADVYCTQYCPG